MTSKKVTRYEMRIVKIGEVREIPAPGLGVTSPEDCLKYFEAIRNEPQEHFVTMTLDGAGNVINTRITTIGLLNHSLVHPREVFRSAIVDSAASIIVAHNHPSGSLEPSSQDIAVTTQLKEAGQIIGIQVLDHLIIGRNGGHVSLRERGLI